MHIHQIRSGKHRQYLKLLLRESYRDGRSIGKYTVANLSGWSKEQIALLEEALAAKRACRGTPLEDQADCQIFSLVLSNVPLSKQWRLFSGRPAPKIHSRSPVHPYGEPGYDFIRYGG